MDILKLSDIIGLEIVELRFYYIPNNEFNMQSFHSYIKLSNDLIIDIPHYSDDEYMVLTQENLDYLKERFETGQSVKDNVKTSFVGQKITDFYFYLSDNEDENDYSAFIKLSNNIYLTEKNFGPIGLTDVDLFILDEKQFLNEVERLKSIKIEVCSFNIKLSN